MTHRDIAAAIGKLIREHGSQKMAANYIGVSPQYLSDVLRGKSGCSEDMARRLGFDRIVTFRRHREDK